MMLMAVARFIQGFTLRLLRGARFTQTRSRPAESFRVADGYMASICIHVFLRIQFTSIFSVAQGEVIFCSEKVTRRSFIAW